MERKGQNLSFRSFLLAVISVTAVLLHVGNFTVFRLPSIAFYALHVMFGLTLTFLYFPLSAHLPNFLRKKPCRTFCLLLDIICMLLIVAVSAYVIINFDAYSQDMQNNIITTPVFILGLILTLLILEAARRVLGITLPLIGILAVIYALAGAYIPGLFGNRGYSLRRVVLALFSDRGIYGVPTGTSASNVFLFLVFAAFLNASGANRIFQDIAIALIGKKRGGPAKISVVASAFFGTISGSCVANVVSTGAFTIPLMKRSGYPAETSGAVEAVSSTGGQIMPPVMGAAAFILADITGLSYARVCLGALIPAFMYYLCLFKMVDLEAVRYNVKSVETDIDLKSTIKGGIKLFLPLTVLLLELLVFQTSAMTAAVVATAVVILCGLFDSKNRLNLQKILDACVAAGKSLCSVLTACAASGIIVGVFSLTGLGLKFSDCIVQIGSSSLILSLILSMLVCAVLGMGLPTTAAYIVCATAIAPALINLQLEPFAAHLFLLYFSCVSAITPPVAVASYAAAGIAKAHPLAVGRKAVKMGIAGFFLPFAFIFNNDYINPLPTFGTILTVISAVLVCFSVAVALEGHIEEKIGIFERVFFFAIACAAITTSELATLIALCAFLALYYRRKLGFFQRIRQKLPNSLGKLRDVLNPYE